MDIHHALDQMEAFLRDFSPFLFEYKQNLVKAGFTEEQAMQLVINYQQNVMQGGQNQ